MNQNVSQNILLLKDNEQIQILQYLSKDFRNKTETAAKNQKASQKINSPAAIFLFFFKKISRARKNKITIRAINCCNINNVKCFRQLAENKC